MSSNRLDAVDTFDQFGHDHWKALGTKLGGVEVVKAILRGTSAATVDIIRRLTSLTSHMVTGNDVNLHDFFKIRKGLWTSDNFDSFILSGASRKTVSVDETTIHYADLAWVANDAEIGGELPEGYVFEDVDTFLVQLATLIESQWGGKEGALRSNGYISIFYVKVKGEVFAVNVLWDAVSQEWDCRTSRLDVGLWNAGNRAFSVTAA